MISTETGRGNQTGAENAKVCACLEKILASPLFSQSERLQRFLKFIVNATLSGHTDRLKGYTIGVEVFDRKSDFDPAIDAIVRVEAARLRAKLREYYDGAGRADPVRFDLPKGAYTPVIQQCTAATTEITTSPVLPGRSRWDVQRPQLIEDRPSLAVLPFANMSGDVKQEYFADGITDTLITELSRLPGLFVISRHSSFVYKTAVKRDEEIAGELGVKYLLEGGVQRSGERVRITVQLIDATSGTHVWAERYDRDLKDIFAMQDDVVRRILAVLQVKLIGEEAKRRGHEGTKNIEAHDCLLRGLERYWLYNQEATEHGRAHFARAVELDPTYAAAHAWLARALVYQWIEYWDPRPEALAEAYEHARTAVDLDLQLPLAHSVLCWVQIWRGEGEAAIASGWKAVALDPNNADAHLFLSCALSASGRAEEGLHYIEKGMRLSPHPSTFYQLAMGQCYYVMEEYDLAIAAFERGVELRNVFYPNHWYLCIIYTLLSREEEAREEREILLKLTGGRRPIQRFMMVEKELRSDMEELARRAGLLE